MPTASHAIKKAHRKQASGVPLKTFAAEVAKNDKALREVATTWQANKKGPPKPTKKAPPKKVEPVIAAKAPPKKR